MGEKKRNGCMCMEKEGHSPRNYRSTNIKDCNGQIPNTENEAEGEEDDLRLLNFHHEKECWEEIKELIRELPWAELFEGKNNEECTEIFIFFIKMICIWKIHRKTIKN